MKKKFLALFLFVVAWPTSVSAANTFSCFWGGGNCFLGASDTCFQGFTVSSAQCVTQTTQQTCEALKTCILKPTLVACTNNPQCRDDISGTDGTAKDSYERYAGCAMSWTGEYYCQLNDTNDPTATGPVQTNTALCDPTGGTPGTGVQTAIGCLAAGDPKLLISQLLGWGVVVGGGIAFLMIILAGFQMTLAAGDPKRVQAARELLMAAIGGLILIVLSLVFLNFIGVSVLGLDKFGFKL